MEKDTATRRRSAACPPGRVQAQGRPPTLPSRAYHTLRVRCFRARRRRRSLRRRTYRGRRPAPTRRAVSPAPPGPAPPACRLREGAPPALRGCRRQCAVHVVSPSAFEPCESVLGQLDHLGANLSSSSSAMASTTFWMPL